MQTFDPGETIFENMDVLNPNKDYHPDDLPERELELSQLHSALRPAMMGSTPINAFVYGHTGQGKTAAISLKTASLEAAAQENDIDLTVVTVRCKGLNKSYHVMTHLIKELRGGPGAELPRGHHQKELFDMIQAELRAIGGTIIVVLDEIDAIGEDDYILYELPRLDLENVRLSIIGITNDYQFRDNLEADVRSSLGEDEVEFSPYNANQLTSILQRRAAKGLKRTGFNENDEFESEILINGAASYCAALCAQDTGDARQAIKLLFNACRRVDDRGEDTVTPDEIDAAQDRLERRAVERGISSLPQQPQYALLAVTKIQLDNETPAGTEEIRPYYEQICNVLTVDALSRRRYREKLNDLASWNILEKETRSRGRNAGRTNYYDLAVDAETVLENISSDTQMMTNIIENLRTSAE
ncbi:Cdc6/Cdc18 family protein [Natronoglomus mannanivorans]|uniref:ORC1-type DNA replication protein n=1 Tax=Natronoglomus mannanivorans TaxID=2979990 RepID=A0AAP2Z3X0_9EURY|nr:AAA family ATPase [Halobacteria archaeon AArc-xg1-1]